MLGYLKQSTASQSRNVGPFISDGDFKTPETGLTINNTDVRLSKNGAVGINKNAGGGTHRDNGMYSLTFDATDTDTLGELAGSILVSGAMVVVFKFVVVSANVYDSLFGSGDRLEVDTQEWKGNAGAVKVGGTTGLPEMQVAAMADSAITPQAGANWEVFFANGAGASTAVVGSVDAAISSRATPAQVRTEAAGALADVHLDHLVGTATGIPALPADTFLDQVMKPAGGAAYNRATDSLKAIRTQGDDAWTTADTVPLAKESTVAAIKVTTDKFTFSVGKVDANLAAWQGNALTGTAMVQDPTTTPKFTADALSLAPTGGGLNPTDTNELRHRLGLSGTKADPGANNASVWSVNATGLLEDSGGLRYTAKALEQAPAGGGGGLTEQQVRDAMKLAPSAGAPAAGSVDLHLDDIQAKTDGLTFTTAGKVDARADLIGAAPVTAQAATNWAAFYDNNGNAGNVTLATVGGLEYGGYVWISTVDGTAGTTPYVNGTRANPVTTVADALTIAAAVGLRALYFLDGSFALTAPLAGYLVEGLDITAVMIDLNGQDVSNSRFFGCALTGTQGGTAGIVVQQCRLADIANADCFAFQCLTNGSITPRAGGNLIALDCYSESDTAVDFDWINNPQLVQLAGFRGAALLKNVPNLAVVSVGIVGQLSIDGSVNAGAQITVNGQGEIVNNSGATLFTNGFLTSKNLDVAVSTRASQASIGGLNDIDAQGVADAMKLAPAAGAPAAGSVQAKLDLAALEATAQGIKAVTDRITFDVADRVNARTVINADKSGYFINGTKTTLDDLQDLTEAQVKAQVVAALATDTYPEPTAAPAATASIAAKVGWMALLSRNRITQTPVQQQVMADDEATPVATAPVSDDGTTAVRGEYA